MLIRRLFLAASLVALSSGPSMAQGATRQSTDTHAAQAPVAQPAPAQPPAAWVVEPRWVRAHEAFLASDALQGRRSATRDEAIAAAYVAAQFESYGLTPAPGMNGYLQTATVVKFKPSGKARLTAGNFELDESKGLVLYYSAGRSVTGKLVIATGEDPATVPAGDVIMLAVSDKTPVSDWIGAAEAKGAKLIIMRESDALKKRWAAMGGRTRTPVFLADAPPKRSRAEMIVLPAAVFDTLKAKTGVTLTLDLGDMQRIESTTTNAIGYLAGSDPSAGVVLVTSHLDHLGVLDDGTVMHGANDDASGTVAVLEVAHALAAGKQPKRGLLFVAYGAEEIGGMGSTYFANHPPIPLERIVANLEFEMIGAQDPKLADGELMMTGFERSNLGETLKAKGARLAADPYPEQHFFQRSDNYSLALKGIVAHTISGWAVTPTYHSPDDTIANLNLPFMTAAIQSLIVPVEYLVNSDFTPEWKTGGRPSE
ncbi:M28 family metallopeptidase [Asticcacaulis sp. 201]|uniref:M28 family metallopeptidase n=1 Tax=Asticcacaulis sp. 201 TaxID=3028787 RepID=UPI002916277A|nr:M20/M25/M40 family metallo-hydrolase [Asticcacaulis sp. 201]MDV6331516.1 M20/M25/M40 family metallo-hydrolase [Asticcacaulis sp. 201]